MGITILCFIASLPTRVKKKSSRGILCHAHLPLTPCEHVPICLKARKIYQKQNLTFMTYKKKTHSFVMFSINFCFRLVSSTTSSILCGRPGPTWCTPTLNKSSKLWRAIDSGTLPKFRTRHRTTTRSVCF